MDALSGLVLEANRAAEAVSLISGKVEGQVGGNFDILCGASLDTSLASSGILSINFDGQTQCNNRVKSGIIRLSLQNYSKGARWKNADAVLLLEMIQLKVYRLSDEKYLSLNGNLSFRNISGGHVRDLLIGVSNPNSVVHAIEGNNLSVNINEGKSRFINLSRKVTYSFSSGDLSMKIEGSGVNVGLTNVESWGETESGDTFTSQITEPVVLKNNCNLWGPVAGKTLLIVNADNKFELATTLGVDRNGDLVSPNSGGCPWGFKIEWTYRNRTNKRIISYY